MSIFSKLSCAHERLVEADGQCKLQSRLVHCVGSISSKRIVHDLSQISENI